MLLRSIKAFKNVTGKKQHPNIIGWIDGSLIQKFVLGLLHVRHLYKVLTSKVFLIYTYIVSYSVIMICYFYLIWMIMKGSRIFNYCYFIRDTWMTTEIQHELTLSWIILIIDAVNELTFLSTQISSQYLQPLLIIR